MLAIARILEIISGQVAIKALLPSASLAALIFVGISIYLSLLAINPKD